MLIREVTREDIPGWRVLAAEAEPVFQAPMAESGEFSSFMKTKIEKREALAAVDRDRGNQLIGIITFSRKNNRISWLAVFERYRGRGAGSKLLECALNQLDRSREITVSTFTEGYEAGKPARSLYLNFGFTDFDATLRDDQGNPRCLMKLLPHWNISQGQSFHYRYGRYMEWTEQEQCPVCMHQPGPADILLIKELEHSWLEASIHAQGCLWGKCHVLCKKHYIELHEMPREDLSNFMQDVQKASRALKAVSGAVKINFEIHGNTMPHLHVHLFPRYLDDPFPSAPIDYRITEPNPYEGEEGFRNFVESMRREME